MSIQPSVKMYISRGVQTGDDIPPSQFSSLCETQSLAVSSALASIHELEGPKQASTVSPDNIRSHLLGTLAYESAYIQSKSAEHSELLPLLSKNKKYAAGLGMLRRSNPTGGQQRIASLPNPPTSQNVPLSDKNTRVVSMPESMISNSATFYSGNSSFSTDHVQNHPSESPIQRQWQHSHNRNYLYDVPQTPSPPSSPDSVEIIGNQPHISGSFLRRSNFDDDGECHVLFLSAIFFSWQTCRLDYLGKFSSQTNTSITRTVIPALCPVSIVRDKHLFFLSISLNTITEAPKGRSLRGTIFHTKSGVLVLAINICTTLQRAQGSRIDTMLLHMLLSGKNTASILHNLSSNPARISNIQLLSMGQRLVW